MANEPHNLTARWTNLLLGAWLFASALLWPHTTAQLWNTLIVGGVVVLATVVALFAPKVRYLSAVAAVWLFFSTWVLPTLRSGTAWSNALAALAIFIVSMIGAYGMPGVERGHAPHRPPAA